MVCSPDDPTRSASSLGRRRVLAYAAAATTLGTAAVLAGESDRAAAAVSLGETSGSVETVADAQALAALSAWGGHSNGKIPAGALTRVVSDVAGSGFLRDDAARQYLKMSLAFAQAIGTSLLITEGYRSFARQTDYWNKYQNGTGNLAAYPGTSNHGWGIACDFGAGVQTAGSAAKRWMDANSMSYGWKPTGNAFSQPEPWHFDYVATYAATTGGGAMTPADAGMMILRAVEPLTEVASIYTAVVGVRSLRHVPVITRINALRVAGVPYFEVTRKAFYEITNGLSIPRKAIRVDADYWRP